ncbi:MAG: putative acetyltransferase [Rhodobacteraceae bacterium HLUCCA08]|nr:MAG: putative acetyltransferase [Rhodobacteraceae bacterium HLUCCA08]
MAVSRGFSEAERGRIAALYWEAFGAKLGRTLGPGDRARAFIAPRLDPDHALVARDGLGHLTGVAGFKTRSGALLDFGIADLVGSYGLFGGLWRATALSLLERDLDNARFLVDGIFVAPEARGRGVGSDLIGALGREALARGYSAVRLDVIDGNDRARRLYERRGFEPVARARTGPLRHLFGFDGATTMVWTLR